MSGAGPPGGGDRLAARQRVLARFLCDEVFEAEVRARPEAVAAAEGASVALLRWLAALEPRRVRAFRDSRAHKDRRRRGEGS